MRQPLMIFATQGSTPGQWWQQLCRIKARQCNKFAFVSKVSRKSSGVKVLRPNRDYGREVNLDVCTRSSVAACSLAVNVIYALIAPVECKQCLSARSHFLIVVRFINYHVLSGISACPLLVTAFYYIFNCGHSSIKRIYLPFELLDRGYCVFRLATTLSILRNF